MAYFKIESEAKAEEISRKMWHIMSPPDTTCTHLFGWGTDHNGQVYIDIPLEESCPVYVNDNFDAVVKSVGELLGIPESEGQQLRAYLEGGRVTMANLIPSTLEEFIPYFEIKNIT